MSLAAETREAARARPFLLDALRAGVVNYRAAAEYLDLDGETDAVATALRRYADELEPVERPSADVPVRMQRGVSLAGVDQTGADPDVEAEDVVVRVGDSQVVRGGEMTAIRAAGGLDSHDLEAVLARLRAAAVVADAAGVVGGELVVVVPRRQGATALRLTETALERAASQG